MSGRWGALSGRRAGALAGTAAWCGVVGLWWGLGELEGWLGGVGWGMRVAGAVAGLLVPGFVMGWPMPVGLRKLEESRPELVPWAWGINGVASVVAGPVAMLVAMGWGYTWVVAAAAGMYAMAGLAWLRWGWDEGKG